MPPKKRVHDRHHIPAPVAGAIQMNPNGAIILGDKAFLDGFKERIHELFLTKQGLPGHAVQVQQEFTRLSKSNLPDDRKRLIGDAAFEQMCKAAKYANITFKQITFTIDSIKRTYYIARNGNGKVIRATT